MCNDEGDALGFRSARFQRFFYFNRTGLKTLPLIGKNGQAFMRTDWHIKDLIDLEYFFELDNQAEEQALRTRDREIYLSAIAPHLAKDAADSKSSETTAPKGVIRKWLEKRREIEKKARGDEVMLPGDAFAEVRRLLLHIAFIIACLGGAGVTFSLLTYKGSEPLNVSVFLGVLVASQIGLLLLLLFGFYLRKQSRLFENSSLVYTLLSRLTIKIARWFREKTLKKLSAAKRDKIQAALGLAHRQRTIYGSVFFWPFFIIGQTVGVGFNLGVLGATFLRVLSADLAFGWQSTIQISPIAVFKTVKAIAAPWSWFVPHGIAHPTLEQIKGSHMVLKDGIYHLATQDLVSWWPFLCLAVCVYGLIPRILLLITGVTVQKRRLRQLNFDHADCDRLMQRLTTPLLETEGQLEPADSDAASKSQPSDRHGFHQPPIDEPTGPGGVRRIIALIPEDLYETASDAELRQNIQKTLGYRLGSKFEVEVDIPADLAVLEQLAAQNGAVNVMLLQEAWQPPIRETLQFIRKIREIAGKKAKIIIALIGKPTLETIFTPVNSDNFKIWEQQISQIGDPYLRLEALKAAV